MLYSMNYLHKGASKIWYVIPEQDRLAFEEAAKIKLGEVAKKDRNFLLDINTMISPTYLQKENVKVYRAEQQEGEFMITFPAAYHSGFSTGFNIAEANNLVCETWLETAELAFDTCRKSREKIPVYPLEWLIVENIRKFEFIELEKETWKKVWKIFVKMVLDEKKYRDKSEVDQCI